MSWVREHKAVRDSGVTKGDENEQGAGGRGGGEQICASRSPDTTFPGLSGHYQS